jgi:SOS-response transcriptional repressor LexA
VEQNVREDTDYPKRMRKIPVVSWAQAGQGIAFEDLCSQINEWVDTDVQDENAYSLIIEGDSMEPAFSAGDRLIVSPNAIPRVGHYVVAQLLTGEIMFKKYFRTGREGKIIRLESINPNYAPREIPQEQFAKIQPVLQCTKIL